MPPNRRVLSMRSYARRIGVNVSTISRQVADGVIPVHCEQGRKVIDPDEADEARAACLHPFWGGKRDPIE
jgi:DNA-binding transcriptional regulator YhcF (GntR family)